MNHPTSFKKPSINQWKKFFKSKGVKEDLVDIYLAYIEKLNSNDLPIIFEFKHLAALLGRTPSYLASLVNASENHYRSFKIPKRRGGSRNISVPYPALMECQYWVAKNLLKNMSVFHTAHGYVNGKSIITNAKSHLNEQCFLKIDIKDFYPSINKSRVISLFKYYGYSHRVSFYMASITTLNNELPQGAPSSPILSNLISFKLDKRLFELSKSLNLNYTRYADDMIFTGQNINVSILNYIKNIIKDEGFVVNDKKTILQNKPRKRIVTGVSIGSGSLKLPRKYKRKLRQELYYIDEYGFYSHVSKLKIRNPNYLDSLIGKVNHWLSIEKNNQEALTYLHKLKTIKKTYDI